MYCSKHLKGVLMPSGGMIEKWIHDFASFITESHHLLVVFNMDFKNEIYTL